MDGPSRPRGLLPVQGPLPVQGALKVWLWRCSNPTLPPGQWQRQGAGTPRPQQAVSVEAETMPVTGGEHGLEDAPGGKGPRKLLPLAAVGREHQLFPGCTGAQTMGLATPPHPCSSLGALTRWGRGLGLALLGETESKGKLPPSQPWSSFPSRCAQTPTPLQLSY